MYEAVVSPGNGGTGRGSRGGSGERQPKGNIHAAPFRPDSAAWSTGTVSSSLRVMGLLAFEDGELGGGADEMGETADHAAGAAVQVAGAAGQGPRLVAVQPQRGLQGGGQSLPLGVAGIGAGADQDAAAGDLLSADAGEQPAL